MSEAISVTLQRVTVSGMRFLVLMIAVTTTVQAQAAPRLSRDDINGLARLQVVINAVHDSANVQLAIPRNTTPSAQATLRAKLDGDITGVIERAGLTEAEFRRRAFLVSTDGPSRKIFDSVVVAVTGSALPGTYVPPTRPQVTVPAGAVGVHLGHVLNGFADTPAGAGLLSVANDEARIAATHAVLAGRQPDNLDYMKVHAGHVINAIDPTIVALGPGLKYGLKKAASGVATHIELAAAADNASAKVKMHAPHVVAAARNTVTRANELLALAQQVQSATSAADAAALVRQMAPLAEQLMLGRDVNADGKVGLEAGEGGLQQADEHIKLMLAPDQQPTQR